MRLEHKGVHTLRGGVFSCAEKQVFICAQIGMHAFVSLCERYSKISAPVVVNANLHVLWKTVCVCVCVSTRLCGV
jgi:hypothetical protein